MRRNTATISSSEATTAAAPVPVIPVHVSPERAAKLAKRALELEAKREARSMPDFFTPSAAAIAWAGRITDKADAAFMARELGVSLEDMTATIEADAAALTEYRATKAQRREARAARIEANRAMLSSVHARALVSLGREVLDVSYIDHSEAREVNVRHGMTETREVVRRFPLKLRCEYRAGADALEVIAPRGRSAEWETVAIIRTLEDVTTYETQVVPRMRRRVLATMPQRSGGNGPRAKHRKNLVSETETRALELAGADAETVAAVRTQLADIRRAYDAAKIGRGNVDNSNGIHGRVSLLSDADKREAARLKKAAQRATKRASLGVVARRYNKGGIGRD